MLSPLAGLTCLDSLAPRVPDELARRALTSSSEQGEEEWNGAYLATL